MSPIRVHDTLAGRYLLQKKIGEGGMGTVYVAHDVELDREVAVKMLASNLVNDPEVVERFEREARLTARLDHPNIVPIFDVGRHEGRPFIVMKLLVGDTLSGVLREKGGFASDDTIALMRQLAAGLDYLHHQGFIHRDIKAGNIFLSPAGLATILDFGILRSRTAGSSLTRTGMVMGTPHYMAPEQAMGLKDLDHRVDLYALAVVLFECLTGTLPFEADSELRLIQMQAHAPPPEILDRAPWIEKPVADVVRKALAKKPDDRYFSGAELVKALEAAYRDSGGHPAAPRGGAAPATAPAKAENAPVGPAQAAVLPGPTSAPSLPVASTAAVAAPSSVPAPSSSALAPVVAAGPMTDALATQVARPSRLPMLTLAMVAVVAVGIALWPPWDDTRGATLKLYPPSALVDAGATALAAYLPLDAGPGDVAGVWRAGLDGEADAGARALVDALADAGGAVSVALRRKGKLNVITMHAGEPYWAQVSIDGVPRGRTPLLLDLPAGRYQLRIERPGFRVQERRVVVAGGKAAVVKIDLAP